MEIKAEALERAKKIKLIIFDVDGVMTDGGIYVGAEGELYKPFNCKDGLGITLAHRSGLRTAIITGRESKQLAYRAGELHITEVMQGHRNKRGAYKELKDRQGLTDAEIAYVGDDLIDLPVMLQVGLPMAVADAVTEVQEASLVISSTFLARFTKDSLTRRLAAASSIPKAGIIWATARSLCFFIRR